MHNRQIEAFIRVADCGSFAKASEALFISTVAVMKQINTLEDRIGVKLLERKAQGVTLTPARQSFYADARELLRDIPAYSAETFNLCARENCLMLSFDIWSDVHPSLVTLPVAWDFQTPFGIVCAKNPSKEMPDFLEYLR